MCRWIAYSGTPIYLHEALFEPEHSLIVQSLSAKSSETTTNGDGFGIGWHPFAHGKWLFVHNGAIDGYEKIRRELMFAVAPEFFNSIEGTTDSELMFYLALTFGMEGDVASGVARMAGFIEMIGEQHGIEHPLQMSLGISDGQNLYAVRYSSVGRSRTLFHSKDVEAIQDVTPEAERVSPKTCAIVSEPLTHLAAAWQEVPEASFLTIARGKVQREEFVPRRP